MKTPLATDADFALIFPAAVLGVALFFWLIRRVRRVKRRAHDRNRYRQLALDCQASALDLAESAMLAEASGDAASAAKYRRIQLDQEALAATNTRIANRLARRWW